MTTTGTLVVAQDRERFKICWNKLAKAKRMKDVDAFDMTVYLETLAPLPMWAIEEAAVELQRTHTFGFPTTDVWFHAAQKEVERRLRETIVQRREWKHECTTCSDSGWQEFTCDHKTRCGRELCRKLGEKHTHTFYRPCACRSTNSTYQRQTQASRLGHGQADR